MLESEDRGFLGNTNWVRRRVMMWSSRGANCRDAGFGEAAAVAEWVAEMGRIGLAGAEEKEAGSVGLEKGDD